MPSFTEQAREVLKQMQQRDYKIMDLNMDCAKDVNIKDLSFGRLALDILEDHYEVATMIYPDLQSPDAEIKKKAWQAFCIDDISLPYRINNKQRGL